MTSNQIEYQKLLETRRANRAQEFLTSRRDEASIYNKEVELSEGKRHNLATESATLEDLGIKRITAEANAKNAETNARNAATNEYNAVTNARNADYNYMQALASQTSAGAAYQSALAAQTSAAAAYFNAEEGQRHHMAEEEVAAYEASVKGQTAKAEIGKAKAQKEYTEAQTEYVQAQTKTEAARTALVQAQTQTEGAKQTQLSTQSALDATRQEYAKQETKWYPVNQVVQNLERGARIYGTISSAVSASKNAKKKSSSLLNGLTTVIG